MTGILKNNEKMSKLLLIFSLCSVFFFCCKSPLDCPSTSEYIKLNQEQHYDYAIAHLEDEPSNDLFYVDEHHNCIEPDSVVILRNRRDIFSDLYANNKGEVIAIQIRPKTTEDEKLINRVNGYLRREEYEIKEYSSIDCNNLSDILSDVIVEDQRTANLKVCGQGETIRRNLQTVVSIIETCPPSVIENLDYEDIITLFIVIQHSNLNNMEKYIPYFKGLFEI